MQHQMGLSSQFRKAKIVPCMNRVNPCIHGAMYTWPRAWQPGPCTSRVAARVHGRLATRGSMGYVCLAKIETKNHSCAACSLHASLALWQYHSACIVVVPPAHYDAPAVSTHDHVNSWALLPLELLGKGSTAPLNCPPNSAKPLLQGSCQQCAAFQARKPSEFATSDTPGHPTAVSHCHISWRLSVQEFQQQ